MLTDIDRRHSRPLYIALYLALAGAAGAVDALYVPWDCVVDGYLTPVAALLPIAFSALLARAGCRRLAATILVGAAVMLALVVLPVIWFAVSYPGRW